MRILVIAQLPPFMVGGAERQSARLIAEWRRLGHDVLVFGRRMEGRALEVEGQRVQVRRIRVLEQWGRPLRGLTYVASLAWLLLRRRRWPDVIYCRFLGEAAVTVALLKRLRLLRAPLVAVPAGAGPQADTAFLRRAPFAASLAPLLEQGCDAINLIAPQMETDLRAFGLSGRQFHRIPNGIALTPMPRRDWHGERRLLTVSRLSDEKGVDVLLRALGLLGGENRAYRLTIVGDGPRREALSELARTLGLEQRVEFTGAAGEAGVRDQLARAHVFVLPSRFEGFSNAALEAMEAGLPVVLTRCGGLDQRIGADLGWVAECDDPASLADALRRALDAPVEALERMGRRCRAEVEAHFDMRIVATRNLDLFHALRVVTRTSSPA